jgi:hypothetical protein
MGGRLRRQRAELEEAGFGCVVEAFAQNLLGARMAFAAAGADVEMLTQFDHRRHAGVDGFADLAIGNVVADTDDHRCTLLRGELFGVVRFQFDPGASRRQDQLVQLRQTQPVDPAFMIDLDFAPMPEQIAALEAFGRVNRCISRLTLLVLNCAVAGRFGCHDGIVYANENNSYLDYSRFCGGMQVLPYGCRFRSVLNSSFNFELV